uniref:Ammonium transporter n=1 Tax=Kalanchoe fedtschenkoi TaxID=63787 RepID=A0A7N0USM4_KALFE
MAVNYTAIYSYLPDGLMPDEGSPDWLNKGDNAWQLTAATMVGLQSVPGLVILYGSMVKKKWAVNSAFMALYGFAAALVCWVSWGHNMSFGPALSGVIGTPQPALDDKHLLVHDKGYLPEADLVFYQFAFAAITIILLGGSLLGRMNFYAWMVFVPLWITFSYTIGAFTIWGKDGFLQSSIIDFSGGYVIHLSSGVAGFTAAYWVGPRIPEDRKSFPPNNIIHMLGGAGFLWMGWTGFNGGSPYAAGLITAQAILNTHVCTATSILVWLSLDMIIYKKSSVVGAVQGMITGLVCITPGAGVVEIWAAILMGAMSGSIPWFTMMVLHKKSAFFQEVDDTLGVFHTHAVAGLLGGILSGIFAHPNLLRIYYNDPDGRSGLLHSLTAGNITSGLNQMLHQIYGALFITAWNIVMTSLICLFIRQFINLKMDLEDLEIGDDAAHGEEAYAIWGDGESIPKSFRLRTPKFGTSCRPRS